MTPAPDGMPTLGPSARSLGVRVPIDIAPDEAGWVAPRTGGMSVSPSSQWNLPHHRRPRGLGRGSTGPGADHVFRFADERARAFSLAVTPDEASPELHAFMEPNERMPLPRYEDGLSRTRDCWERVWP